ncbi:hypothetical protein HK405_007079, partial [Cladochytrium tenue]
MAPRRSRSWPALSLAVAAITAPPVALAASYGAWVEGDPPAGSGGLPNTADYVLGYVANVDMPGAYDVDSASILSQKVSFASCASLAKTADTSVFDFVLWGYDSASPGCYLKKYFDGFDLVTSYLTSKESCATDCQSNSNCVAAIYDNSLGTCNLKQLSTNANVYAFIPWWNWPDFSFTSDASASSSSSSVTGTNANIAVSDSKTSSSTSNTLAPESSSVSSNGTGSNGSGSSGDGVTSSSGSSSPTTSSGLSSSAIAAIA